jgi:acetyl-CoA carboxylase biotin carboxylase subunit
MRKVLIANRGEIAVRILRACREEGLATVAVFSEADREAPHVLMADEAFSIGPPPAAESYLRIDRLLDAARRAGADAVHPGYGFLAENARFAEACQTAGLTFVGPPPGAIHALGDKTAARRLAREVDVPMVPGTLQPLASDAEALAVARQIGLPVMIKAALGGGGKGMRLVAREAELAEALRVARSEAQGAFGDSAVYLERFVAEPRHIEVQVLADAGGAVIHLGERECSIQRRHQKLIEESPSPAVDPALRQRMGEAAVAVAHAAGYRNAGTVEFLLEGAGDSARFYFLEMNTRLQVEHPVTELVTGVDLVRAQIAIASGAPVPWTQHELTQRGHAIELRVYAEDPAQQDLPQAGPLLLYREPSMPGIRVDAGVTEGSEVGVHYDPLLAKLIAYGETRDAARQRAAAALRSYPILGIRTNIALLTELVGHPRFIAGQIDTSFLDTEGDAIRARLSTAPPPEVQAIADAARAHGSHAMPGRPQSSGVDPWTSLRGARV